jgi:hypothetical protein
MDPATLARHYLLFFILPLWIAAGLADYYLHRRTLIQHTSGTGESLLHALQLGEAGLPVLMGLLLDINALVILLMLVALALHEVTALYDLQYTVHRRYISPLEQHVHSFLELLPLMGVSFISLLYWDQFSALFGLGTEAPRFTFAWKDPPLSPLYLALLFALIGLFIVLPFAEELWRCLQADQRRAARVRDESMKRAA